MSKYPTLFTPFQLGSLTLKNRIVSSPTSLAEIGPNNSFSPENIAYFELRAKGGAAAVAAWVTSTSRPRRGKRHVLPNLARKAWRKPSFWN